jgi:hypothetical protein
MADFNVRSDAVNVEQLMEQIRARIREKRGVDYTEAEIRELADVKLEKFLDPRGVRSDLLEQFRTSQVPPVPEIPNYAFEDDTLFASTRGPVRWIRRLLLPILKLFFNPNPLIQALHIQSQINASIPRRDQARYAFDRLYYEVMHNLVVEITRLSIEVTNLKMRVESLTSRLEFNERRARALESAVVYKPSDDRPAREERARRDDRTQRDEGRRGDMQARQERPAQAAAVEALTAEPTASANADAPPQDATAPGTEGPGQRSRRRRRRRGRRGNRPAAALMGGSQQSDGSGSPLPLEDGDDQTDDTDAEGDSEPVEAAAEAGASEDLRTARPEPIENASGAQAHPAEAEASDPPPAAHQPEPSQPADRATGTADPGRDSPPHPPAEPPATPEP